jgi:prolyl oligopeptidase
LGTKKSEDRLVFESPEKLPSMLFLVTDAPGGNFMAYRKFHSAAPLSLYWGERKAGRVQWALIQAANDHNRTGGYIGRIDDELIFKSAECGNNYCLIGIKLSPPFQRRLVVPYSKTEVLSGAQIVGPYLHVQYFDLKFRNSFKTFRTDGTLMRSFRPSALGLNDLGSLSGISGHPHSRKGYFTYSALDLPPVTFRYDLATFRIERLPAVKPHPFEMGIPVKTELRFYKSSDGRLIPIHVYTRTDLKEKPRFALLFYYGAIGATYFSSFSTRWLLALEMGGMVAVPNVRGGGEGGHQWFLDGAKNKRSTIDDIAWASRWLKKNYAIEKDRVVAEGGSWGGLHTYMTLQKFPDDFDAFIADVPVASIEYSYQNLFGWLLPDDLAPRRDYRGDLLSFPAELKKIGTWSPLENVSSMKRMKPLLTVFTRNDERAGHEQGPFMIRALENKFGPDLPSYVIARDKGGHSTAAVLPESLAFVAHLYGIKSLIPLDRK